MFGAALCMRVCCADMSVCSWANTSPMLPIRIPASNCRKDFIQNLTQLDVRNARQLATTEGVLGPAPQVLVIMCCLKTERCFLVSKKEHSMLIDMPVTR